MTENSQKTNEFNNDVNTLNEVIPLESNPTVFTEFAHSLGLSPILSFTDIYSVSDPDLLAFLPRPIKAIVLLFPISEGYEKMMKAEESRRDSCVLELDSQSQQKTSKFVPRLYQTESNIIWMKQNIKNACGLYALLHILLNIPNGLVVRDSIVFNLKEALISSENADVSKLVRDIGGSMHKDYAVQGQTAAPAAEEDVDLHFVCFVNTERGIVELDGRRGGAVVLQESCDEIGDIIESPAVIKRVEQYMSLADGENALKFAMMGLAPSME